MTFSEFLDKKILIFEITLFAACLFGDHFMSYSPWLSAIKMHASLIRALIDSLTHGLVGFFSWAIVISMKLKNKDILQCMACLIMACLVDIDHFLAAGSFKLKDALSLPDRPPFHLTTLIPVISLIMVVLGFIFSKKNLDTVCLMYITAWTSHHIRDSTRRGLWLSPFGNTSPLPYSLYISLILTFPLLIKVLWIMIKSSRKQIENDDVETTYIL